MPKTLICASCSQAERSFSCLCCLILYTVTVAHIAEAGRDIFTFEAEEVQKHITNHRAPEHLMSLAVDTPRIVLLISGKRKCGKDYLSDALLKRIGTDRAQIVRISEPIKRHWANTMGLDLDELLGDSAYKERYRQQMIEWSEEQRRRDYGIFCREACRTILREVCIVSDVRRRTDICYFVDTYGKARIRTVRIEANDEARAVRGWHFQRGVDDVPSECDLDVFNEWDLRIANNCSANVEDLLGQMVKLLDS